jgi:aminopeptidase N
LLSALEETSGRDLGSWSKEWLQTAGVNTLRPSYSVDEAGRFSAFSVLQSAAPSHPTLRSHRVAIGLYTLAPEGLVRTSSVETDVTGDWTPVPELVGVTRPDLVLINDDDLTYAKIRLDPHSLRTAVSSVGSFTSSLPAALVWAATWDMVRDGEMAARDYVRLVLGGVDSVRDISVAQTLLRQASTSVRRFADPAWRSQGLELMAASLLLLLKGAEPGSDTQLAYVRALCDVATSETDLAYLAGLRSGAVSLDGLSVDTELRWRLLHGLIARGAADPAEIDAALASDLTDAGERHAAACRAAIPTAAAKRTAWDLILSGKLTLATFRAALGGFVDPDQEDLLRGYTDEYFRALAPVWEQWSGTMAQDFVSGAYLLCPISSETVAATDSYAESRPPATLWRLLLEGRDEVQRALRNQAVDLEKEL